MPLIYTLGHTTYASPAPIYTNVYSLVSTRPCHSFVPVQGGPVGRATMVVVVVELGEHSSHYTKRVVVILVKTDYLV